MRRTHTIGISLLLAVATAAGAAAAVKTVHLGAATAASKPVRVPDRVIAARRAKLAAWSAALRHEAAARPPALPKVPHHAPVVVPEVPLAARGNSTVPAGRHGVGDSVVHVPEQPAPPVTQQRIQYVQAPTTTAPATEPEADDHESEGYGDNGRERGDG